MVVLADVDRPKRSRNGPDGYCDDTISFSWSSYCNLLCTKRLGGKMIECEDCGMKYTEQEIDGYSWHCRNCGHKIGD